MKVIKASSRPTKLAPADNFTGTVMQDEVVVGVAPSRLRATSVSFTPGARTAWHTHPVGQTLYVLYGSGRVQMVGAKPIVLSPGDTVHITARCRSIGTARRPTVCSSTWRFPKTPPMAAAPNGWRRSQTQTTTRLPSSPPD